MKTLLYRSLLLLALVNYSGMTCADSDSTKIPEWLVNVETPLANQGVHCTGALLEKDWLITVGDCARDKLEHITIKFVDDVKETPEEVSAIAKKIVDDEITLLKLSRKLDRETVKLSNATENKPCDTWHCLYYERLIPGLLIPTVKLKYVSLPFLSELPATCKSLFPHTKHLFCALPISGDVVSDQFIRAAALVDDKGDLAGLGVINYAAVSGQTQSYNIFLPLDRYQSLIKTALSEKDKEL